MCAAQEAAVTKAPKQEKLARPIKYKAATPKMVEIARTDQKLLNLLQAPEYQGILEVAEHLQKEGLLREFCDRAKDYYSGVNVDDFQEMKPKEQLKTLKRDWTRVWPTKLDKRRAEMFDKTTTFLNMLDKSGLVDQLMGGFARGGNEIERYQDAASVDKMADAERRQEVRRRVLSTKIMKQYLKRCEDEDYTWYKKQQSLDTSLIQEFFIDLVVLYRDKERDYKIELPDEVSLALYSFLAGSWLVFCVFLFKVNVPFLNEVPDMPTGSTPALYSAEISLSEETKQADAEAKLSPQTPFDPADALRQLSPSGSVLDTSSIPFQS